MDGQFDAIMSRDAYRKFPDPEPLVSLCGELGLKPSEVLVVVRSSAGVRAAKCVIFSHLWLVCMAIASCSLPVLTDVALV